MPASAVPLLAKSAKAAAPVKRAPFDAVPEKVKLSLGAGVAAVGAEDVALCGAKRLLRVL